MEVALAGRARFADGNVGGGHAGRSARLGEAVHLMDVDAHLEVLMNERDRHGCSTTEEPAHALLVVLGGVVGDPHCLQHRGYKQRVVDALFGHQFPRLHRIERAHQNLSEAAIRGDHRRAQRTHMEQRHRVEIAVANAEITRGIEREQCGHLSVVRVHHTLG